MAACGPPFLFVAGLNLRECGFDCTRFMPDGGADAPKCTAANRQTPVSFTRSTPILPAALSAPLFGASHLGQFLGYPTAQAI